MALPRSFSIKYERHFSLDCKGVCTSKYICLQPVFRIRSDPVFLHGSGSGFQISLDPIPVFKFLWIRIRFQPRFWNKKNCRKVSKSDLSEENLKFMTRQKMKKATISY